MSALNDLTEAIKKGDRKLATASTETELAAGTSPNTILEALIEGMDDVGQRFKANQIFVPEVLIAARAMKEAMAILEPKLVEAGYKPLATAVVGTVEGDLHDIGKNLVVMMLKGASFQVIDLGTNVSPEKFVEAVKESGATVVGLSALLTTTMPAMKKTIDAINEARLEGVSVIIGGAPVTQAFADEVGANGFAPDAASAVDTVRTLINA
ncbi:cobalamin B12-binding domain-containing protein [Mucisphaera calidilacus]|uniref:Methionine synthase n=1 Tax=Mucisphaera calidilacus TaxID=2527982 RepID=A0A518BWT4_9BACT|nr:corrinoid protein [Mucisphaera calidilacus]QDU71437.1 Methionine synthase [Mucisphaera calidilacus]